jgi:phage terminase small subunit
MAVSKTTEAPPKKLTDKQQQFCLQYIIDLNATQAAIRAGYSKKTAAAIGHENLRKPEIQAFVKGKLEEAQISAEETTKLLSDIARSNLSNYFVSKKVEYYPRVEKLLVDVIAELKQQIEVEKLVSANVKMDRTLRMKHNRDQMELAATLIRFEQELSVNPKATKIVDGPPMWVDKVELDLNALVADKERGKIKSVEHTRYGLKVELYSADDALTNMARIHGKFEKDNTQKSMNIKVTRK